LLHQAFVRKRRQERKQAARGTVARVGMKAGVAVGMDAGGESGDDAKIEVYSGNTQRRYALSAERVALSARHVAYWR